MTAPLWHIPTEKDQPWRARAKCRGQDIRLYEIGSMPRGRNASTSRAIIAQARCSGCPVKRECAEDALAHNDVGVIRAGVLLPGSNRNTEHHIALRALAKAAGQAVEEVSPKRKVTWPRHCGKCDRMMRPRRTTEDEYPGTVTAMNVTTCGPCWQNARRSAIGRKKKESV